MSSRPESLNGIPVPYGASVAELARQLRPPGQRAWAACAALGHGTTRESLQLLVWLTSDPDWCYRGAAIEALGSHPLGSECPQIVCRALRDESPWVVMQACRTAAAIPIPQAHDLVEQLLGSQNPKIREVAVESLAGLAVPTDIDRLLAVFRRDRVEDVRRAAAWALKPLASPQNWRSLFEAWIADPLPRHRVWACEIAVSFGDHAARSEVRQHARDADGHVRKAVRRLLRVL